MANLKSAKKYIISSNKKREANQVYKSRVKNSIKNLEKAITADDKNEAEELLKTVIKNIDKAVSKKVMKPNTANRQKSRLNKKVKEIK